ncbi:hypothetical protein AVEN_178796-1 [Araneus ventricosus]|uniref:Uncharacterized protein n=1 Tax=Araneus ventricosus TaxID=182803 RepID=A0A4Y2BG27_ARAVE|nr:hypothetical protein AVEN_178796-1 [Araneus ventricosus]
MSGGTVSNARLENGGLEARRFAVYKSLVHVKSIVMCQTLGSWCGVEVGFTGRKVGWLNQPAAGVQKRFSILYKKVATYRNSISKCMKELKDSRSVNDKPQSGELLFSEEIEASLEEICQESVEKDRIFLIFFIDYILSITYICKVTTVLSYKRVSWKNKPGRSTVDMRDTVKESSESPLR